MTLDTRIRPIADRDWDGIVALEADAYTAIGLSEERAALESRVSASPATCFALEQGESLAGYLLALPYPLLRYPELAGAERTVFRSSNLHLHDLVVAGSLRGRGLGRRLLGHLTATARSHGYERISLVAVAGSGTFWSANGFAVHREVVPSADYGESAAYMSRALGADETGKSKSTGVVRRGSSPQDGVG